MKRMALVGVLVCLCAGTARAQSESGDEPREIGAQRVILKGVSAEGQMTPSAAASLLSGVTMSQPNGAAAATATHDIAKCNGCGQEVTDCCCSCPWTFSGGYMYLQPRGADAVFAARSTACAGAGLAPLLGVEQIDFGGNSGFIIGLAKTLCDGCSEIGVTWMHYEAEENDRAVAIAPEVLFPLLVIDPTVTCNAATSTLARASQGIDFDRVALDYRHYFEWCCTRFDWVVGAAYGQLEQDLIGRYDDTRAVFVSTETWGYGAHLGFGGEYGKGCLRGFGHVDLTLLASNGKARYRQIEKGGVVPVLADVEVDIDRIIPILDLELGVAWDVCSNTTLKVGYLYSFWFNVLTTPDFVRDVQQIHFDSSDGDTLSFDGLVARLEIRW